mmetsp:Transcript_12735/g.15808  ORF Transcript_12735/g.15808 Transcript_12735/m.15808 type:complete len:82 (+) Transcript_12735:211-456(+)
MKASTILHFHWKENRALSTRGSFIAVLKWIATLVASCLIKFAQASSVITFNTGFCFVQTPESQLEVNNFSSFIKLSLLFPS